jgi:hypothetical protein
MVALDSAAKAHFPIRFNLSAMLAAGGLLGGVCMAGVPVAFLGSTYEGWALATRTTDEFSGLLLLVAFLADPLTRLFPHRFPHERRSDCRRLAFGFAAAYVVYLIAAIFAATADGRHLGTPQTVGLAIQFCALAVLVVPLDTWPTGAIGRRLHTAALWFFWLIYTFAYAGHFAGPHPPDSSFGIGLFLLMTGLLIRFVAALKTRWVRPLAEKVG